MGNGSPRNSPRSARRLAGQGGYSPAGSPRQGRRQLQFEGGHTNNTHRISDLAMRLFEGLTPTASEYERRAQLLASLVGVVQDRWKGAKVDVYGSSASNLALRGADVDATMCFNDPDHWSTVLEASEDMDFSDDEAYDFQYSRGARTKPTEGRNDAHKWEDKEKKRAKKLEEKREKKRKEREAKKKGEKAEKAEASDGASKEASAESDDDGEEKTKSENFGGPGNLIVRLGRDLVVFGMEEVMPLPKVRPFGNALYRRSLLHAHW